jgi:hypothetical protein
MTFEEAAEKMAAVVKKTAVTVEEFGKVLRGAMTAGDDAVKAAGAGRRLRKYLEDGLTIEEIKALYEEKEE